MQKLARNVENKRCHITRANNDDMKLSLCQKVRKVSTSLQFKFKHFRKMIALKQILKYEWK